MELDLILKVLNSPPWSKKKLDEAARGLVQGSCDDPPEIQLKFWIELAKDRAEQIGESADVAIQNLVVQALQGDFK